VTTRAATRGEREWWWAQQQQPLLLATPLTGNSHKRLKGADCGGWRIGWEVGGNLVHKSICNGAQYIKLQKYFSHSSLVKCSLLFSNPTHKLKLGLQTGTRVGTNSNSPGPSNLANQQQVLCFAVSFYQPQQTKQK